MRSSRGQSFDVFQLLIAAIVAGAILVILLNIISIITPPGSNLNQEATSLVKTGLTSSYGAPVSKNRLSIDGTTILSPTTIARETDISAGDVCVSAGDFTPDLGTLFEYPNNSTGLKYLGSGKKTIGLTVVCGRGQDLTDGLSYITPNVQEWTQQCGGGTWSCLEPGSTQTCCVVAVRQS